MRKGNLTREQAVAMVGESSVLAVENENCDFTNRVQTDGDDSVEFSASVRCSIISGDDYFQEGDRVLLVAYYYQDEAALDGIEDLGSLDWEIEGYEIA